jgi:hypothetical protein
MSHHLRMHPIARVLATLVVILCTLSAAGAAAGERPPFEASGGLDIARAGALAWSHDAVLIYVENDEDLDAAGAAPRWGYLFYSALLKKARGYSVREGKILVAENLDMKFEAPPVADSWIDSGAALLAADKEAGQEFCRKHGGKLTTMLLMRGAFADKNPDQTTWTVVYSAAGAPSLFVVVDASDGSVRRTWRG